MARPDATASEVLASLAGLPALVRACVFEVETGAVRSAIGSAGNPPPSLLAWARHASEVSQQRGHALEDVIVTSTEAHHLLRELPSSGSSALWVHVEVDGRRGNLALARRQLSRAAHRPGPAALVPAAAPAPAALVAAAAPATAALAAAPTPRTRAVPTRAVPTPAAPAPAVPAPALTMLPALDEEWRGPVIPAPRTALPATTLAAALAAAPVVPTTRPATPAPVTEPAGAPTRTVPRRVPLMGRPPIAFVVPPTVPPPPLPGTEPEVASVVTDVPEAPEQPAADKPAAGEAAAPEAAAVVLPELPTRTPGEHAPALPSPASHRARERPTGWGTDGSTLRRLLVGLRRLA